MEALGILVIIFAGFIFVMFRNAAEEKKRILRYKDYLRDNFGKYNPKLYKDDSYSLVPAQFLQDSSEEFVDDITWHDFGMDDIYKK